MNHTFMCKVVGHSLYKADDGKSPDLVDVLINGDFGHTSFLVSPEGANMYPLGADVIVRLELAPKPVT